MRHILHCIICLLIFIGELPLARAVDDAAVSDTDPSIVVGVSSITYHAHAGDTLISIAEHWTNRPENWTALAKVNHIAQDSSIPIGSAIVIPADLLKDVPSEASVVALSGTVTANAADGKPIPIQIGAKLEEGAQIETGVNGFLTLALPDASRISLPSNSRVRFAKLRMTRFTKSPRTELMLLRGHVESRVSPLDVNKGIYEVRTPLSVAGVRGTQFRVGIDGGKVTNEVLSGAVAVDQSQKESELTLQGGQGNVITSKNVGPAVNLLPAPQLDSLSGGLNPQIRLVPVAGASAYHVQIAFDADALNVLMEGRSNDANVKLFGLRHGNYFARVSAIDKYGLEGFARIQAVNFGAENQETERSLTSAPFVDGSNEKEVTLRWHGLPSKEFIVQVAHDPQFTWLIFNSTTHGETVVHLPRPPFGTYYARVQSTNPDGSTNAFSPIQTFIVTDHWVINDNGSANSKKASTSAGHL